MPTETENPTRPRLLTLTVTSAEKLWQVKLTDVRSGESATAPFQFPDVLQIIRARQLILQSRLTDDQSVTGLNKAGEDFFAALLPGRVGELFARIWNEGERVQLHLEFSPPAPDRPDLRLVPWELLRHQGEFLATNSDFILTRHAALGRKKPSPQSLTLPLRLLVLVSSPLNLEAREQLDPDKELMLIRKELKGAIQRGEVEVEFEDIASLSQIQKTLDSFKPHVLHFTGHGYASPATTTRSAETGLLLEQGEKGEKTLVAAREFAKILENRPDLRLVVLSACRSALAGTDAALASVAEEVIAAGVPAVVAMLDSVRDDTATTFAASFYQRLVAGEAASVVLTQARQLLAQVTDTVGKASDWALPALVTGAPQLELFNFTTSTTPRPRAETRYLELSSLKEDDYFIGRRFEQRELRRVLTGNKERLAIIHGMGGQGKSALTQRSLERAATHFQGVVVQTFRGTENNLPGYLSITTALAEKLPGLKSWLDGYKGEPYPQECGRELARALNSGTRPYLLVLDNFEDLINWREGKKSGEATLLPRQPELGKMLEALLLGLDGGRVLITSRFDFSFAPNNRHTAQICRLPLDAMPPLEALRLMGEQSHLKNISDRDKVTLYGNGVNFPLIIESANTRLRTFGSLDVNKQYTQEMLYEEQYAALPPEAQTLLQRISVYNRPVPLEFYSKQQAGAGKWVGFLTNYNFTRRYESLDENGEVEGTFAQHEMARQFGLEKLEAQGQAALQTAHLKAAEHYEHYATHNSHELAEYLEANTHFLAGGAVREAARLVRSLNSYLDRAGLWRLGLELNRQLNKLWMSGQAELDSFTRADLLKNEADLMGGLGEVAQSIELYQEALNLFVAEGNRQGEGVILGNLGNAYFSLGHYPKAIEYQEKSLKIAQEIGDRSGEGNAYGNLGIAYYNLGDYPKAIEYQEKSLGIAKEIGDRSGEGSAYGNLGVAYDSLGDYPKAIEYEIRSSLIMLQIQSPGIRQALNMLKGVRRKVGIGEFERLVVEVCGRLGLEYARYRQLLEQGGVFAEQSKGKLNPQLEAVAKAIGLALSGNETALKDLTAQILPQLEREGSGFEKLAGFLNRLLVGEFTQTIFQQELNSLDETARAIVQLAFETAQSQAASESEASGSARDKTLTEAMVSALQGEEGWRKTMQTAVEKMQEDKGTRKLGVMLELMLEGERNPETLTRGLSEEEKAVITQILANLK